jgi:3-polyprenyl-4-hydroxybenzoate decarboxylase
MYSSLLGGGLCTECYLERFGDKGRLVNIMKESELKEDIRILTAELKEKTKEYAFVNHKEKLDQLLKNHIETEKLNNEILKNTNEALKVELSYFKAGFGTDELKIILEQLKKQIDMMKEESEKFKEQIQATQPLVRDLQDFDERYFLERLKKRKSLNELSEQYP